MNRKKNFYRDSLGRRYSINRNILPSSLSFSFSLTHIVSFLASLCVCVRVGVNPCCVHCLWVSNIGRKIRPHHEISKKNINGRRRCVKEALVVSEFLICDFLTKWGSTLDVKSISALVISPGQCLGTVMGEIPVVPT